MISAAKREREMRRPHLSASSHITESDVARIAAATHRGEQRGAPSGSDSLHCTLKTAWLASCRCHGWQSNANGGNAAAMTNGPDDVARSALFSLRLRSLHRWRDAATSPLCADRCETDDLSIELVDPKVLRVCADPRNMPFSNEKGEGFENKLAELFADKLQKKLDYMYLPAGDRLRADDARRASLRRHHGLSARRRPRPGHQSLLPHGLCAGRQDRAAASMTSRRSSDAA